jgi:hypothetical protein
VTDPLPPSLLSSGSDVDEWVGELATSEPNALPERIQSWRIDGTGSAEWAMGMLAEAERALAKHTDQAVQWYAEADAVKAERYARIDDWLAHESAPHRRTAAFFTAHLERYALDQREADPRKKSVTLPSGKVTTHGKAAKVVVTVEATVMEWAKAHAPAAVKRETVETLLLTPLRSVVKARKVWTLAWVQNSCGCKVSVRDDEGLDLPEIGTLVESCSECGAEALIGKIEPLAYRWLAVTEDGAHVPGVDVQPDEVTAKVVLG